MKCYQNRFFQIAQELEVTSSQSYRLFSHEEKLFKEWRQEEASESSQEELEVRMARELSYLIYAHYHLCSRNEVQRLQQGSPDDLIPVMMREHPEFGVRLRGANQGEGYLDAGWTITQVNSDALEVVKGPIRLSARPDELWSSETSFLRTQKVSVRFPKDRPYANSGYYTVVGNAGPSDSRTGKLVRIYFNVRSLDMPDLLATLTKALNKLYLQFLLKVLNHPDAYPRSDSAVLYLLHQSFSTLRPLLREISAASFLVDTTSFFTKPLACGIAIAEETASETARYMSFGQHRSWLVGQGIAHAFFSGKNSLEDRYECILHEFQAANLDISQPYLDAGSLDIYDAFSSKIPSTDLPIAL